MTTARGRPCLVAVVVALAAADASAQSLDGAAAATVHANAPQVRARRVTSIVRVDGRLDEAAWSEAQPVTEFTQLDPDEGAPVSERTEVRVLYDDDALFIGARMHDRQPVRTRLGRRDMGRGDSDWFAVIIDSYHDHLSAYVFLLNPSGVKRDAVRSEGVNADPTWDAVWEGSATIDDGGWTAEIRIPFSQIRYNPQEDAVWGIQFERDIQRRGEYAMFAFTSKSELAGPARYAHMVGLGRLPNSRQLELLPYTVARTERIERGPNPFRSTIENGASAGLDLLWRASSDFTLNATINPDFGQVEVDPAVVNLTALETFFEERRPFFTEGANAFGFGRHAVGPGSQYANLFYSRRIGRSPQLAPPSIEADVPAATTILGAAKLTGRTAGGWSVGVVQAVTGRERARYRIGPDTALSVVEPLAHYGVARIARQRADGTRSVGLIVTGVHRDLDDERARAQLRAQAWGGGLDYNHEWGNRTWSVSGFLAGSHVRGDSAAVRNTQISPARYFQRPDSRRLELDGRRTSLSGMAGQIQLRRIAGEHWRGDAGVFFASPGYEVNDLGFQNRADQFGANGLVTYNRNTPGRLLRNYNAGGTFTVAKNFDGDDIAKSVAAFFGGQFLDFSGWYANVMRGFERSDDRLTRGGPLTWFPSQWTGELRLFSDPRRPFQLEAYVNGSTWPTGGWQTTSRITATWRPGPNLLLSIAPQLERGYGTAQYVGTFSDAHAPARGTRYVFADIERTTVSAVTRLNVTFSPTTSLELYAQPFLSSGDFGTPKELVEPRTLGWAYYGRDAGTYKPEEEGYRIDPDGTGPAPSFALPELDFNIRSLRGNAVFRWEWRPGSTLFLAWQQIRADRQPLGSFLFQRDLRALFDSAPDNVLLLKVNYWLSI